MKHLLILLCFSLSFYYTIKAQDLIVTTKGDSINCVITKVQSDHIFFTYFLEGKQVNSLLSLDKVVAYTTDYYQVSPAEVPIKKPKIASPIAYDVSGGFSYRLAGIDPSADLFLKDYMYGLLLGLYFGGDISYYFYESLGIGAKLSSAVYSNKMENIQVTYSNGTSRIGTVSDNIWLTYVGPSLTFRYFPGQNNSELTMGGTLGYIRYHNNCVVIDPFKLTGNSIGVGVDFAYKFELAQNSKLGVKFSYLMGILSKMQVQDNSGSYTYEMEAGQYESLSRFDLGVVLSF